MDHGRKEIHIFITVCFKFFWQQEEIFSQTLLLFADSIILTFLADVNKIPSQISGIIRSLFVGRRLEKLMTASLNY